MRSIAVNSATSVVELNQFLKPLGKEGLRGKKLPDGSYLLYASKGSGTGLKNRLFKTIDQRRLLAESIIESISQNAQIALPADDKIFFRDRLEEDFGRSEITANTAQTFVRGVAQKTALPDGIRLDEAGNLSGSCRIGKAGTKGPIARTREETKNKKLGVYIDELYQNPKQFNINAGLNGAVDMQAIDASSFGDLGRNKYEIPKADGSIFEPHVTLKEAKESDRRTAVIHALKEFAGNANATRILTSFSQQRIPIAFFKYLRTADGQTMDFLRMIKLSDSLQQLYIIDASGAKRPLTEDEKLGLGNAVYKFGKKGEDFVISIDLKCFANVSHGYDDIFPLPKDHVIGIDFTAEIVVDGKKAQEGILEIKGFEADAAFSGRLKSYSQAMRDLKSIELSFDEAGNGQLPVSMDLANDEAKLSSINGLGSAITYYMEFPYINGKPGSPPFDSNFAIESMYDIILHREGRRTNLQNLLTANEISNESIRQSAVDLSKQMTKDLVSLKFGSEFFTNEKEFISKLPAKDQPPVREFGQHLKAYYQSLIEPDGQYMCLSRIAGLAMNAPTEFSAALKRYRSENSDTPPNMSVLPEDQLEISDASQALIDPALLVV